MDFALTEQQESIRQMVRTFGEKEIEPYIDQWEEERHFPKHLFASMAGLGLAGMTCSEAFGGSALDRVSMALVAEELGRVARSLSFIAIHNMVVSLLAAEGTEAQKQQWLPPMARGQALGAFALTEPEAGSDNRSLRTSAVRDGDQYVLDGTKQFISHADQAEVLAVAVRTAPANEPHGGISVVLVEAGTPGLSIPKREKKMGLHSTTTCQVVFEKCRVPVEHRIGEENGGLRLMLRALAGGRINTAAFAVGGAQRAFEEARDYAGQRVQFGRPIASFQAIQFMLADMKMQLDAARLLVYRAATLLDQGHRGVLEAAVAKCFATDMAMKVTTDAVQVLGGYGYIQDYKVERYMRDAKLGQIVEGTNQIQRLLIGRELLKEGASAKS